MLAFVIHVIAMLTIALAAIRAETDLPLRVRIFAAGVCLWTIGDLVAQWVAFGPPWGR